ncbi:serine/threonine-protein kinase [Deinococcus sp. HSC-46F16]|uniref:serine/threonine-protein kinase n=1 Tax=Deinococcus sp. HSC-46F16 TaxID=2910968 RepID=UPI0035324747
MPRVPRLSESFPLRDLRVLGRHGGLETARATWGGQPVFVKRLWRDDPLARTSLTHEGAVAARLGHSGLLPLLAAREAELIFPWVPGGTLRDALEDGPLPVGEALAVAGDLLDVLAHLHAQGVVHHDLKPENVLLCGGERQAGAVRLIDFGLSCARFRPDPHSVEARLGTPHYMAPEQFAGVRGDPRSDLYAVGAVLFECLAGSPPHADPLGWLAGHRRDRSPLPGPPALHPVLEAALCRGAAGRPPDALSLRQQLDWAAHELESPCP